MTDFLIVILINSLAIIGLHQTTREGMVFSEVKKKLDKILPLWIRKPLYDCPPCMASLHWFPYVLWYGISVSQLKFIPVYVLALSGMNILLNSIVFYFEIEKED